MLVLLYIINSLICIVNLIKREEETFSLSKIVYVFVLVFFIAANYSQYANHINSTSLIIHFEEYDYLHFQIMIFAILIIYGTLYSLYRGHEPDVSSSDEIVLKEGVATKLILISVISFLITFYTYRNQPIFMFMRGFSSDVFESEVTNSSLSLIISKFIRPIPFACYLFYKISDCCNRKYSFMLFLIMTVSIFPLALARNAVAMYWIPVLLVNIKYVYRKHFFSVGLIVVIFVVFPLMDNFRYYSGELDINISYNYLQTMNFDASQMFMAVVKFDIITYGRQLLGALFFFVPRSLWVDKPVGSGYFIAESQGAFSNVSMPYFGEGYINFGYLGVLIFTIVLARVTAYLDWEFWGEKSCHDSRSKGMYLISIGAMIFIMRGDLLNGVAYTIGTMSCYWVICYLAGKERLNCASFDNSCNIE